MLKLLEKLGLSQTCSNTESERFLSTVRDRPAKAENDATSFASVSNNLVAIVLSFSVSPTLQQLNQYETYKDAKTWSEPGATATGFFHIREFVATAFRRPCDSRYLKSNILRHAGADRESRRIPAFYCLAAKSASLKPRCLFRSARNGTSGTRWNKHRRFCTFWQNLGLPFGSAVGLCPTVPLPIDGSEAACRRQPLSLLTDLRDPYCWRLLQTFRS